MKLAVFHSRFDEVGGAELLAAKQARLLRALGAEVRVRTFVYNAATWGPRLGSIPVEAYSRHIEGRTAPRVPLQLTGPAAAWAQRGLDAFDAVIAHNFPSSALLGLSPAPAHRIWYCHEPPRSLHPREANPNLWKALRTRPTVRGWAVEAFTRSQLAPWLLGGLTRSGRFRLGVEDVRAVAGLSEIWANSEFTRDNVRRIFGPKQVEVVYPIADVSPRSHPRHGLDRSGLRVLTVSRLEHVKNLDTLLRGFARFVRGRGGAAATLDVVGLGPVRAELEALARSLGIEASVRFHGFLSQADLDDLSSRCDVFALLPLDEPFGMVFPEAASRGLLLLGPDQGGPREILDDGRIGQMADPLDPEQIADGLARIWATPDAQLDALRERAVESCRARFSLEAIGPRIESLLRRRGLRFTP
ncbi:MAG: glycosyltransferase [Myxococcales bacterium]|nr:MAG: glycosyltransferase [Myxococcales bacterium]